MQLTIDGNRASFNEAFASREGISSISPLTSLRIAGVLRRPIVNTDLLVHVAAIVRGIFEVTPTRASFGSLTTWQPGRAFVNAVKTKPRTLDKRKCHFGHTSTGDYDGGQPHWPVMPDPSPWHGVAAGVTLCSACYQRAMKKRRLLPASASNDPSVNADAPTCGLGEEALFRL